VEVEALEPRDAGFAIAAIAVEGDDAPAIASRAPRGAGPRLEATLRELLSDGAEKARGKLGPVVDAMRRSGPGTMLASVHPSWLADSLADEPDEVIEAVVHGLPEKIEAEVRSALVRLSRPAPSGPRATGLKAELEPLIAEKYRRRAFPNAGRAGLDGVPLTTELSWLVAAPASEIEIVAREVGIRAVARAFSGISREDLGKLCQGLPPNDSVRVVSAVVELRDAYAQKTEELRKLQKLHLKLIRAGGISPELFSDSGLAFIAQALLVKLPERARYALAYRFPELLGRRLLDLSAPGASLDDATREAFAAELPAWLGELKTKGVAAHYKGGGKS
jgi:hypothetical protein